MPADFPRTAAVLFAATLSAPIARAESPVARLAGRVADEIARVARGRAVEVMIPEDRSGRGASLALDLRALVIARLAGRANLTESGPRLRVASVLSESPRRLVVSARVVEEPGGRLFDLLSVSVDADDRVLDLAPLRAAPAHVVDVVAATRTPPLDGPVLDLGFLGEDRMVVLTTESVALYRWDGSGLALGSRRRLPGPFTAVRAPGGVLLTIEGDRSFWALTSRSPAASLFAVDNDKIVPRLEATALPWPGVPGGLRYRAGTNLLEGAVPGLGSGPFLVLAKGEEGLAVSADGRLRVVGLEGPGGELRVGPALAALWEGLLAASSADPPGSEDSLLLIAREEGGPRMVDRLPVQGAIRALAAHGRGEIVRLVAAVEEPGGTTRLVVSDLQRREP